MNPTRILGGTVALVVLIGIVVANWRTDGGSTTPIPGALRPVAGEPAAQPTGHSPSSSSTSNATTPAAPVAAAQARTVGFPTLTAIPSGSALHTELTQLTPAARERALAKLARLDCGPEDADSLHVDPLGSLYYACEMVGAPAPRAISTPASATSGATAASAVPTSQPPARHSRSGSGNVIYLDFNGHQISTTAWNLATSTQPAVATYDCRPYDTDGSPNTFSDQEQADILEIWARVAEDYAPFDVDVTTEEPGSFSSRVGRVLITSATDRNGITMPRANNANVAGVAYLDAFGEANYSYLSPALIYFDRLYSQPDYIAEAASHEMGHNLALSHDGITGGDEYYAGHGNGDTSWAPIMGAAYSQNVSQWSKGDFTGANNLQDDLQILANHLGYAADDFGNTRAAATPFTIAGSALSASGCLGTTGDADVFSFTISVGSGSCSFSALPYRAPSRTAGGNADLKLTLLDAAGTAIATSDPTWTTAANLTANTLGAGTYYLQISTAGTGAPFGSPPIGYTPYGSVGRYTISGQLTLLAKPVIDQPSTGSGVFGGPLEYSISATNPVVSYGATGLPTGVSVDPGSGRISGTPLQAGIFDITLSATNAAGTGTRSFQLVINTAPPAITTAPARRTVLAPGQGGTLGVAVVSLSGNPTYRWFRQGHEILNATGASLSIAPASRDTAGWYQVAITDSYGTRLSPPAFVLVAPQATSVLVYQSVLSSVSSPPSPLVNPIACSLSYRHALALQRDGSVRAWGTGRGNGETSVPNYLGEVVAVAAAESRSLALQADGTIVPWGGDMAFRSVPAHAQPAVGIALSGSTAFAVKPDGSVVWWGADPSLPAGLSNVASIATSADAGHAMALHRDGTFTHWNYGDGPTSVPPSLTQVVAATTASGATFALTPERNLVAWSQLPNDSRVAPPSDLGPVTEISASVHLAIAVDSYGRARGWGSPYPNCYPEAPGLDFIWSVAAGYGCSLLVQDDSPNLLVLRTRPTDSITVRGGTAVFSAGFVGRPTPTLRWQTYNAATSLWDDLIDSSTVEGSATGTLRLLNVTDAQNQMRLRCRAENGGTAPLITNVVRLTVAAECIVTLDQTVRQVVKLWDPLELSVSVSGQTPLSFQWYRRGFPLPGATARILRIASVGPQETGWYRVAVTTALGTTLSREYHVLCRGTHPKIVTWGIGTIPTPNTIVDPVEVAAGISAFNFAAVSADGTVSTWGYSSTTTPPAPPPSSLHDAVSVCIGRTYSAGLSSTGAIVAEGSTSGWFVPPSALPHDIVQMAGNNNCILAVRRNGQVCAARADSAPTVVSGIPADLQNVVAVAASASHAVALLADGTVRTWGANTTWSLFPPSGLSEVVAVAAGTDNCLALKADGTVVCWGDNSSGQAPPTLQLTDVVAIAGGTSYSAALLRSGQIVQWGSPKSSPAIPDTGFVTSISAGSLFGIALVSSGAPALVAAPNNCTVTAPGSARFHAEAIGEPTPNFRWQRLATDSAEWEDLVDTAVFHGTQTSELLVDVPSEVYNGDQFRCVIANGIGTGLVTPSALLSVMTSYTCFKGRYFTAEELAEPTISGTEADPDHDGIPNLIEYALGRNPRNADAEPALTCRLDGDSVVLSYASPSNLGDADFPIRLESSFDLKNWEPVQPEDCVITELEPPFYGIDYTIPIQAGSPRFFRLSVSLY